jgi:hypothetical protein
LVAFRSLSSFVSGSYRPLTPLKFMPTDIDSQPRVGPVRLQANSLQNSLAKVASSRATVRGKTQASIFAISVDCCSLAYPPSGLTNRRSFQNRLSRLGGFDDV